MSLGFRGINLLGILYHNSREKKVQEKKTFLPRIVAFGEQETVLKNSYSIWGEKRQQKKDKTFVILCNTSSHSGQEMEMTTEEQLQ